MAARRSGCAPVLRGASDKDGGHVLRTVLLACLALFLTACDLAEHDRRIASGIGTSLYTPQIAGRTRDLELYLGYVCYQAGLAGPVAAPNAAPVCDFGGNPENWRLVVAAGWNDIDARCDEYLAWLDEQRRRRQFVTAEIGHIRTLTAGVLGVADVATATIAIVGTALGFAQDTYSAYQNQLLLDIEGSTIETIVIERRLKYREAFAARTVSYKPDAVKLMQDYLRICTPYAIRMSINTYSRAQASGVAAPEEREAERLGRSLLSGQLTAATAVDVKPARPERPKPPGWERATASGVPLDVETAKAIQRAVCLPPGEQDGIYGPKTETHLKLFETINARDFRDAGWLGRPVQLSTTDVNTLTARAGGGCGTARNYYELWLSTTSPSEWNRVLAAIAERQGIAPAGSIEALRPAIEQWRRELNPPSQARSYLQTQLTPDFMAASGLIPGR